ncbi:myosin-1-like isoform X2 [Pseudomyrmex gracilis]|uniref:myosin-1-like isoform X2 n=1 Tax=Pseudomyrmex gracilis TaxID=219809 RepID=UPI000994A95B|nr:myosin-1-like isoform X2 [Pseudomyrmex gracilis]
MCSIAEKLIHSSIWDVIDDLSAIPQENVVSYLLDRVPHGKIYTWIGPTLLLALNPIDKMSISNNPLYDLSFNKYDNIGSSTHKEVVPHIYAVASRAHHRIVHGFGKPSQMIVLSGETGAGKTFNAWKVLSFLTRSSLSKCDAQKRDETCDILQKIMLARSLISDFTTAPTEKNDNSSRHVQLLWLEYKMGNVCGATISSYLLETNKVTKNSCNFHIFNQMIAFADLKFERIFELIENRRCFALSDVDPAKKQDLRENFLATLDRMNALGFTRDRQRDIFQVLCLIVRMSNIQFVQTNDRCKIDIDNEQSKEAVEDTCKLACLEKDDVNQLLTSVLIRPQSSYPYTECRRNLGTEDACRYRLRSIIRHMYELLFHWLISSVNKIMSAGGIHSEKLGILDIFGFECFNTNGIEQLCVNYVNERLQQYFVKNYLASCREDLEREDLIDYHGDTESPDILKLYDDRLNAIEKHLFAPSNDICLSIPSSDSSMLMRYVDARTCSSTRRFLYTKNEKFVIHHYASVVEYSASDILANNIDKIPDEITTTFGKNKFLYFLISERERHYSKKPKRSTTLSKLQCNVDLLINELNKCDLHYVRCIKPQRLDNHEWDRVGFYKQLVGAGVIDALPLARCKYPIRFSYKEFFARYNRRREASVDFETSCRQILRSSRLMEDEDVASVHYGKRLIFLTETAFLQLESARRQHRIACVKKIESFWLKYRNYRRQNEGAIDNDQLIIATNDSQHKLTEQLLLSERTATTFKIDSSTNVLYKTRDVLNWLQTVNKPINITQNTESLTSKRTSKNRTFQMQNICGEMFKNYKEGDMYIVQCGACTLFYKNRILSRRYPSEVKYRNLCYKKVLEKFLKKLYYFTVSSQDTYSAVVFKKFALRITYRTTTRFTRIKRFVQYVNNAACVRYNCSVFLTSPTSSRTFLVRIKSRKNKMVNTR